jgi:hypothetical protein
MLERARVTLPQTLKIAFKAKSPSAFIMGFQKFDNFLERQ